MTSAREQRGDANLLLGWLKVVLRLASLLLDRILELYRHLSVRVSLCRDPIVPCGVSGNRHGHNAPQDARQDLLHWLGRGFNLRFSDNYSGPRSIRSGKFR
jgi:hypothetical protein